MTPEELTKLAAESSRYDSLSNLYGLINIGLVILTALVTIATFYYGNKASDAKQAMADQKIAEANAKAAIANQNAESAKTESASANAVATEAKNKQAELTIALNESNTRRDKAEYELNKKIEEDREKAKPRQLTDQQSADLLKVLSKGPIPTEKTLVVAVLGVLEAKSYASQFYLMLKAAKWPVDPTGVGNAPVNDAGVVVFVKNNQKIPPHARLLENALNQIGVKYRTQHLPTLEITEDEVLILIGSKHIE